MSDGPDLGPLERRLDHQFSDPSLLRQALAHRSWCAEQPGEASNERLEFLGDAVLGWVVADIAYRTRSELPEGKLTDLRKAVVNAAALAEVARELDLGDQILLGKGEAAAGGRRKPSILADALEAVIGAVYLDAGADTAHRLVTRLFGPRLDAAIEGLAGLDHKTTLQELAARRLDTVPSYEVEQEGPDHAKTFRARVRLHGVVWGVGEGRSKKRAEQAAAKEACRRLLDEEPVGLG